MIVNAFKQLINRKDSVVVPTIASNYICDDCIV